VRRRILVITTMRRPVRLVVLQPTPLIFQPTHFTIRQRCILIIFWIRRTRPRLPAQRVCSIVLAYS